ARAAEMQGRTNEPNEPLAYNRGMNFRRMGQTAAALAAFVEAERTAGESGHAIVLQRARAERLALEAAGESDLPAGTRAALQEIVSHQRDLADPSGAAITLLRLSDAAMRAGAAKEALLRAREARGLLPDGVFEFEQREALLAELAALQALGDWRPALAASEQLRTLEIAGLHRSLD